MSLPRLFAATLGLAAGLAAADPGHYLLVPYDNEGLRTVEVRYWSVTRRQRPELTWPELGVGYGFNSRWTSTLYMSWIGSSARATKPATLNWQNTFLLTQGEWPVDVALHLQRIQPQQPGENRALEFGLLLQGDIGRTQFNTNLIVERHLAGPPTPTALKLQWQLRHRSGPGLQFGLLGFDELGPWRDWSPHKRQSHRAGPAVFDAWSLSDRQGVKFQAAWLLGKTYGRTGHMFSTRLAVDI